MPRHRHSRIRGGDAPKFRITADPLRVGKRLLLTRAKLYAAGVSRRTPSCLIRRASWKARNSVLDLAIGELPEIRIIEADRAEKLVILEADHVVSLLPHGDERIGRRDGYGEHQPARLTA